MRVFLLLLICLQIACSRQGVKVETGKSAADGKDACSVLTLEDARAVYGSDMARSKNNRSFSGPAANLSTCTYENDKKSPMTMATLSVTWTKSTAHPLASRESYISGLENALGKEVVKSMKMEQVDFQGLPAIWDPAMGQMVVFKQGVMATLLADAAPGKNKRQTTETLMGKVSGRL